MHPNLLRAMPLMVFAALPLRSQTASSHAKINDQPSSNACVSGPNGPSINFSHSPCGYQNVVGGTARALSLGQVAPQRIEVDAGAWRDGPAVPFQTQSDATAALYGSILGNSGAGDKLKFHFFNSSANAFGNGTNGGDFSNPNYGYLGASLNGFDNNASLGILVWDPNYTVPTYLGSNYTITSIAFNASSALTSLQFDFTVGFSNHQGITPFSFDGSAGARAISSGGVANAASAAYMSMYLNDIEWLNANDETAGDVRYNLDGTYTLIPLESSTAPEPGSLALVLTGIVAALGVRRRLRSARGPWRKRE